MTRHELGLAILDDATREFSRIVLRLNRGEAWADTEEALRGVHRMLRSSMNWLEDTGDFRRAHWLLDAAGRLARRRFYRGCQFAFENGQYHQRCPVALAHSRVGMSIGGEILEMHCSICLSDPEDCEHIAGRVYGGTRCQRVITEINLVEISLVSRPNQPDARIESMSFSHEEMVGQLGEEFNPGIDVICDRCKSPCQGINDAFKTDVGNWRVA
jgi:hypothetical protein